MDFTGAGSSKDRDQLAFDMTGADFSLNDLALDGLPPPPQHGSLLSPSTPLCSDLIPPQCSEPFVTMSERSDFWKDGLYDFSGLPGLGSIRSPLRSNSSERQNLMKLAMKRVPSFRFNGSEQDRMSGSLSATGSGRYSHMTPDALFEKSMQHLQAAGVFDADGNLPLIPSETQLETQYTTSMFAWQQEQQDQQRNTVYHQTLPYDNFAVPTSTAGNSSERQQIRKEQVAVRQRDSHGNDSQGVSQRHKNEGQLGSSSASLSHSSGTPPELPSAKRLVGSSLETPDAQQQQSSRSASSRFPTAPPPSSSSGDVRTEAATAFSGGLVAGSFMANTSNGTRRRGRRGRDRESSRSGRKAGSRRGSLTLSGGSDRGNSEGLVIGVSEAMKEGSDRSKRSGNSSFSSASPTHCLNASKHEADDVRKGGIAKKRPSQQQRKSTVSCAPGELFPHHQPPTESDPAVSGFWNCVPPQSHRLSTLPSQTTTAERQEQLSGEKWAAYRQSWPAAVVNTSGPAKASIERSQSAVIAPPSDAVSNKEWQKEHLRLRLMEMGHRKSASGDGAAQETSTQRSSPSIEDRNSSNGSSQLKGSRKKNAGVTIKVSIFSSFNFLVVSSCGSASLRSED